MKTLIDFDNAVVFAIPGSHQGMLLEGPQGWGEFSPPPGVDDGQAVRWLTAAVEPGTVGWPDPVRGRIPVAVQIPGVSPQEAHQLASTSGCQTAEVTVGDSADDLTRLAAVREALGPAGRIRCVVDAVWDVDTAVAAIGALAAAAGELEYVEQPCVLLAELAEVRRGVDVRIAADLGRVAAREWATVADCADVAVLTGAALGGVRRALRAAESVGLPSVVRSRPETSVG
ncbi:MAG: enolase C-terminal domain-like protein, partial [Mycobacterium sp.]